MNCVNHAEVAASGACVACAESFCGNCLVSIAGKQYCGKCKSLAVKAGLGPMGDCHEAGEALKYSIVGIFCFGIILEPIAIYKALEAKKMIAANPRLAGAGKANAALVIGIVSLLLWILGMVARVSMQR